MPRTPDESRQQEINPAARSTEYMARERERARANYTANRDKILAQQKRQRDANRAQIRERDREYREAHRNERRAGDIHRAHGLSPAGWAALWDAQHGLCYLCGEEMRRQGARVDHDHACCPEERSCAACRRGLCHDSCNKAIGLAGDDPDRLERMAAALRAAKDAATARIAACPVQLVLDA